MTEQTAQRALAAILILFLGLGSAYALTTPTLEAPDEIYHYDYVRALVNTGRPPVLKQGGGRGFGHHAPLYYAYGALVSFWVGENDWNVWPQRHNPFFGYRFGEVGRDNKNLYIHPDSDSFGQSDTWLGIRVVRLASVVLGAMTVWVIFRVGREVFPERPAMALGAAGLAAFIPEFLFISGAVNDDNGATLFGALAIWAMVRILRKGPTRRRCAALGLALGLGWLSKLTVVALLPAAGLTLAMTAWRDQSWRKLLRLGLITFGVAALLIGPWLVRQTVLYGDPTGTSREMSEWGLREEPVTLANLGPDLYWLRTSFWGRLGYNQIPLSEWIYTLLDIATLLAALGLAYRLVLHIYKGVQAAHRSGPGTSEAAGAPSSRRQGSGTRTGDGTAEAAFTSTVKSQLLDLLSKTRGSQFTVLAGSLMLTFGPMIVRRFLRPMPNFGRYLFPVLPSIALLMITGLSAWFPRHINHYLCVGVTVAMLALGITGLTCFLAPAYARPPILDDVESLEPTHRADRVYLEDGEPLARLVGYDLDQQTVKPGEKARVTLYWEVLEKTDANYILFAQLFGRNEAKVGQRDTYPGLGHYPTSFWEPGGVIVDDVPIPVNVEAEAPSRLRLDVGLYQRGNGRLTAVDSESNQNQSATIGWLKLLPTAAPPLPAVTTDYYGDNVARLTGYDLERESRHLHLTLHWSCRAPMDRDYIVFVHLLDGDGNLLAQADGPPAGGDYPTSFWETGEIVVDRHTLDVEDVPPGLYDLQIGLYLLDTGERLPISNADGERLTNDAIPLAEVHLP